MDEHNFGSSLGWAIAIAAIGTFIRHISEWEKGLRDFWSWHLLIGVPTAVCMGFTGAGMAEWLNLGPNASVGFIAFAGYIGPPGLQAVFDKFLEISPPKTPKK